MDIELLTNGVEEHRARQFQHEIEEEDDGEADGQHPKRRDGLVRQHAIIDVHREQGRRETDEVDHQCCENDREERLFLRLHRPPEPVSLGNLRRALAVMVLRIVMRDHDDAAPVVELAEFLERNGAYAAALRHEDAAGLLVGQAQQYDRTVATKDDDCRQVDDAEIGQIAHDGLRDEADTGCCALE